MATELFPVTGMVRGRTWLIPGLLPANEVVLLDGATGVGKSALCASWLAELSKLQEQSALPRKLLYISSDDQADVRNHYLATQNAYTDVIFDADYQPPSRATKPAEQQSFVMHLLFFIKSQLVEHQPLMMVIDSLEDLLVFNGATELQTWQTFWRSLKQLAIQHKCTIVIPRRQGLHEPRQYGLYTKTGIEMVQYILTLHWHPIHPQQRVISVARNLIGCLGEQYHLSFDHAGFITTRHVARHEHVRPAKSPQTWQPDPDHVYEHQQIADEVLKLMSNQPTKTTDLKKALHEQGYSERAVLRTLGLMKLACRNVNGTWMYLPDEPVEEMRTRGAAVVGEYRCAG